MPSAKNVGAQCPTKMPQRSDNAIQEKLNAIADSLSDLMKAQGLEKDAAELRSAVGLEDRESSDEK